MTSPARKRQKMKLTETITVTPRLKPMHSSPVTPNKPVNMPAYCENSNKLYYGPPVVSQPIASPPLGSTNNLLIHSQNLSSHSSDPLRCGTGNNGS